MLQQKVTFFLEEYNKSAAKRVAEGVVIKWSENLKRYLARGTSARSNQGDIQTISYRPFSDLWMSYNPILVDRPGRYDSAFPCNAENQAINFSFGPRLPFSALGVKRPSSYSFYSLDPSHYFPRYLYIKSGERVNNITDWAVAQFRAH